MKIFLLSHEKELNRRTNTGKLVAQFLKQDCQIIPWRRTEPAPVLLSALETGRLALLSPAATGEHCVADFDSFVLIDSTWQEAGKIYRHSPYLHSLPKVSCVTRQSEFFLRANQVSGGLSTAECVIDLLRQQQRDSEAEQLQAQFQAFIRACL